MRGPIDYIIVGFDGNKFDGSILRAIGDAVDSGAVDLVALVVVSKDTDGTTSLLNVTDLGDQYVVDFVQTHSLHNDWVDQDDIDEVAELIEPNTTAGLLVVEQLWAKPLKKALLDAEGYLISEGRIHPDAAEEHENDEEE